MRQEKLLSLLNRVFFYLMAACALAGIVLAVSSCAEQVESRPVAPLDHRVCFGTPVLIFCGASMNDLECARVADAVDWWNHQLSGVTFFHYVAHRYEPALEPRVFPQNVVVIGLAQKWLTGFVPDLDSKLAITAYRAHPLSHCLTAAMMFFIHPPRTMSYDGAENVIRHELGHVLGLLDSDDETGLMMRSADPQSFIPAQLSEAELNALRALYGKL